MYVKNIFVNLNVSLLKKEKLYILFRICSDNENTLNVTYRNRTSFNLTVSRNT